MIRSLIHRSIVGIDDMLARLFIGTSPDAPKLVIWAVHSVLESPRDLEREIMHPQQRLLAAELHVLVAHMLERGFTFVRPADVLAGLDPAGRFAMLTFDDGYHNNLLALEMLRQFDVPAVFFIVPSHVETGEAFWWDAVYRRGRRAGASEEQIEDLVSELKALHPSHIRGSLYDRGFREEDFRPACDIDRPLNRAELTALARETVTILGNHTYGHEILVRCSRDEQVETLVRTQDYLESVCGRRPDVIAYPNGDCNRSVFEAARAAGLGLGCSLDPCWNSVSIGGDHRLRLGRFLLWGGGDPVRQASRARLRFSASRIVAAWKRRNRARRVVPNKLNSKVSGVAR